MSRFFFVGFLAVFFCAHAVAQEKIEPQQKERTEVTYSEIRKLIENGEVKSASVTGDGWWVSVVTIDGNRSYAQVTPQTPIADHLYDAGIPVKIVHWNEDEDETPLWLKVFYNVLPLLIFIVFFVFVMFLLRGVNGKVFKKNDEHLAKAEAINNDHLAKVEEMQKRFFERLEKLLSEKKRE